MEFLSGYRKCKQFGRPKKLKWEDKTEQVADMKKHHITNSVCYIIVISFFFQLQLTNSMDRNNINLEKRSVDKVISCC